MTNKWPHLIALCLCLLLIGAGCTIPGSPHGISTHSSTSTGTDDHHATESSSSSDATAVLAGTRVILENANALQPGPVTLAFKLYDAKGSELTPDDLVIVHEKRLHLLLVRDDMTQFQHLHPEYADRVWTVKTTISEQGAYNLYVDIDPVQEVPSVLRVPVRIGGATIAPATPTPNPAMSATAQSITTSLTTSGTLVSGKTQRLRFSLKKDGKPITTIAPYLGAFGHVVLLQHTKPDTFLHVHPVTMSQPTNGEVMFETKFSHAGRYTLYAQFYVEGSVQTFPITVDIE